MTAPAAPETEALEAKALEWLRSRGFLGVETSAWNEANVKSLTALLVKVAGEAAAEMLDKFGDHNFDCDWHDPRNGPASCNCGFADAAARLGLVGAPGQEGT